MNTNHLSQFLDFATETAYLAGRITLGFFQTAETADFKSDDTPVTIADLRAEELIRRRIKEHYPRHSILGEEYGMEENEDTSHCWIIDPIDGTKSFICGVPLYSVLIGLEIHGKIEVGVAYFPALNEMIAAGTGLGCWWNGRRASVSKVSNLNRGIITCTTTQNFKKYNRYEEWKRLLDNCYFQAGWGDAYGYLLVATGRAELMLDPIMNVWDCAPFPPILGEAGGFFGDWNGNTTIYGKEALGTSQLLLPQVLALLNPQIA